MGAFWLLVKRYQYLSTRMIVSTRIVTDGLAGSGECHRKRE
jgi:hypothetical protein